MSALPAHPAALHPARRRGAARCGRLPFFAVDGRLVKTAARADVLQQEGTQDEPLSFSAVFGGMSESVYGYEGETDLPTRVIVLIKNSIQKKKKNKR